MPAGMLLVHMHECFERQALAATRFPVVNKRSRIRWAHGCASRRKEQWRRILQFFSPSIRDTISSRHRNRSLSVCHCVFFFLCLQYPVSLLKKKTSRHHDLENAKLFLLNRQAQSTTHADARQRTHGWHFLESYIAANKPWPTKKRNAESARRFFV